MPPNFNFERRGTGVVELANQMPAKPTVQTAGGGYEAHHIIPVSVFTGADPTSTTRKNKFKEIYQEAGKGFDINDPRNGIWLPSTLQRTEAADLASSPTNCQPIPA